MTEAQRAQFEKEACDLHDRVHEAAALVDYHTRVEIGWAPEEAIPILADALQTAYARGAADGEQMMLNRIRGRRSSCSR